VYLEIETEVYEWILLNQHIFHNTMDRQTHHWTKLMRNFEVKQWSGQTRTVERRLCYSLLAYHHWWRWRLSYVHCPCIPVFTINTEFNRWYRWLLKGLVLELFISYIGDIQASKDNGGTFWDGSDGEANKIRWGNQHFCITNQITIMRECSQWGF